jgi:HEAT repeat protein
LSKQAFERKLEQIEALRTLPEAEAIPLLRKALHDRNNYAAGKAARIVGERLLHALHPDLIEAFERFLQDPVKTDPQCWAKNALAKSLKDLGHSDAEVFIRGIKHIQLEPVWGSSQDTAATVRGTCALALTACGLTAHEVLLHLVDLLADREAAARQDAVRAVGQLGTIEGTLLLRLKSMSGDEEPAVTGLCFSALIDMLPRDYLPFVSKFLNSPSRDLAMEAAGALCATRESEALPLIEAFWNRLIDQEMKRDLLIIIGGSPNPASVDLLRSIAESTSGNLAEQARELLARSRFAQRS